MFGAVNLAVVGAVIAALAGIGSGGALAWQWQANKYDKRIAQMQAEAENAARQREQEYAKQARKSEQASAQRQQNLRRDTERARLVADGLRHDLGRAVEMSRTSPATCPDRAAAISDILRELEAEGRAVSETADRHVESVRSLLERWPGK
jgi:biopolymer transport protein ExbB/TolQ